MVRLEWNSTFWISITYFNKKTHRHVEWVVITPPRMGPRMLAMAKTEETTAMYLPCFSRGTTPGAMTKTIENIPEPPIPWKARNMILFNMRLFFQNKHSALPIATYSSSIEFEQPQAIEKAVKSTRARRNMVFRPNISLNLA